MCLNKKVLVGLGVIAAGVLVLRPAWAATALPLLVIAACPLSMMFMMRGMGSGQGGASCGTGRMSRSADPTSAAGPNRQGQIEALQAELRALTATDAADGSASADAHDTPGMAAKSPVGVPAPRRPADDRYPQPPARG